MRLPVLLLPLGLLMLAAPMPQAGENKNEQERAIAEIKKLGGRVEVIVKVSLGNTDVTDAGLVHLKGLTHVQASTCTSRRSRMPGSRTSKA